MEAIIATKRQFALHVMCDEMPRGRPTCYTSYSYPKNMLSKLKEVIEYKSNQQYRQPAKRTLQCLIVIYTLLCFRIKSFLDGTLDNSILLPHPRSSHNCIESEFQNSFVIVHTKPAEIPIIDDSLSLRKIDTSMHRGLHPLPSAGGNVRASFSE